MVRYRTGDLDAPARELGRAELEELSLGLRTFEASSAVSRKCSCARRRAPHRHRLRAATTSATCCAMQVVQEDLDEARILVLPDEDFCDDDAENLLANARARIPPRRQRDGGDRDAPGAHAARQDAADRAPAAGARCAAPRMASSRSFTRSGTRMQQPGWYCSACDGCRAPRWRTAWRAACAWCRSNSRSNDMPPRDAFGARPALPAAVRRHRAGTR